MRSFQKQVFPRNKLHIYYQLATENRLIRKEPVIDKTGGPT